MGTDASGFDHLDDLRVGVSRRRGTTSSALYVLAGVAALQTLVAEASIGYRVWLAVPLAGAAVLMLALVMHVRARHRGYALKTRPVWITGAALLAVPLIAPTVLTVGIFTETLAPAAVAIAATTAAFTRSAQPQVLGAAALCVVVSIGTALFWWANYLGANFLGPAMLTLALFMWARTQAVHETATPVAAAA